MARGVLLDIDGVLTVSWRPLPGAVETMSWLRRHGIAYRLVTNTSSRSRRQIAALLGDAGMEVDPAHIVTAVSSAARYLSETYPGRGCLLVNDGSVGDDLQDLERADPSSAGVVLLGGAGPGGGYAELNAVFRLAMEGVPVVALHRNTRFATADGPSLDMGAFIVGIELAASVEISVVGKPAPAFFASALHALGVGADEAIMVGDDIDADVLGSQAVGITGVLVRTGKYRASDLERDTPPDLVIDSVAALPELLSRPADETRPDG
jgi:HAD superfamily hydrolase (TIGR01458 family)